MVDFYLIDFAFLFTLGITASLHCVGMCGGIACSYAIPVSQKFPKALWKYHSTYVLGRILAYSWIGALLGAVGMGFGFVAGPDSTLQHVGTVFAALIMLIGGAASTFGRKWPDRIASVISSSFRVFTAPVRQWSTRFGPWRALPLGMLSGILPCGMMWAVELRALATNSLLWGMVTMLVFCLITTPPLLMASTIMAKVSPRFRFRSVQFAGIIVMGMGAYLIWKHYVAIQTWFLYLCDPI
ncbi:MAG: sulfite exporter TauE/SafE family protein [SAR324 cluster bacterium]|nr:sulfite exporter TauE/SafE family protein [SAR324 cluster bacterium]